MTWRISLIGLMLLPLMAHGEEIAPSMLTVCQHLVPAAVMRVIDGDTFVVQARIWEHQIWEGSVRLRHINAPETRSRCQEEREAAVKATAALTALLPTQTVVLLCNPTADVYPGRVDATVILRNGQTVSGLLLAQGVVRPYDWKKKRPAWCEEKGP